MTLNFANLSKAQAYQVLTHCIIPRPVAWIMTRNENHSWNLAPFSFFQAIGSQPPTLMFSIGFKADGIKKDTLINIERESNYVIHIANTQLAEAVNLSAKPLAYNESETELCQLETEAVNDWPLPRVKSAPVAFLCQLHKTNLIANMTVVYGEVLASWIDDAVLDSAPMDDTPDLPNPRKLDPLVRLGYRSYTSLGEPFELVRPT